MHRILRLKLTGLTIGMATSADGIRWLSKHHKIAICIGMEDEMNRLGMVIDVSHVSDKAFFDVIETSHAPVIASHSSVRGLCDVKRNMSDEMIRALAHNGGVIHICIPGACIAPEDTNSENYIKHEALRLKYHNWQYRDDYERKAAWKSYDSVNKFCPPVLPTIAQAVDHIDYVIKLVGIDYEQIDKIWGGNFLRVFTAVESARGT